MKTRSLTVKILDRVARLAGSGARMTQNALRRRELADLSLERALSIQTHMTIAELDAIYRLALDIPQGGRALEVGSYLGASSCRIAAALFSNDGRLYCVDTWENETMPEGMRDTFAEFQKNTNGAAFRITTVRKRSGEMVASDFSLPFDFAFIDADHTYPAVRGDVDLVSEWLRDGSVLAMHDVTFFEAVSRVVGEMLATGEWQLIGHVDNLVWLRKLGAAGSFPNPMLVAESSSR